MARVVKRKLSGSSDGMGIAVAQTATPGDTVHTAVAGTAAGTYDEIWLWAQNNGTSDIRLSVEFGTAGTTNNIAVDVPSLVGLVPVLPGLILQNGRTVKAFAAEANKITVVGFVNSTVD